MYSDRVSAKIKLGNKQRERLFMAIGTEPGSYTNHNTIIGQIEGRVPIKTEIGEKDEIIIEEKPFYRELIRIADIVNHNGLNALESGDRQTWEQYNDYLERVKKMPLEHSDKVRLRELCSLPEESLSRPNQRERHDLLGRLGPNESFLED